MHNSKNLLCLCIISLCFPVIASAQDAFAALQFLVGNWEAEPTATVTVARTDFALDLQGKALVRHNHAEYPAANGKPPYTHDDLLVVYREVKPVATKGLYLDSDGYYARYTVTSSAPGQATFVSDVIPGFPRYRTSYAFLPDGRLSTSIEVSPAGKANAFAPFLQWMSKCAGASASNPSPTAKAITSRLEFEATRGLTSNAKRRKLFGDAMA